MSNTPAAPIDDAVALLGTLTADAIRDRLDAIDAEARALRVLMRSLRARESAQRRKQGVKPQSEAVQS